MGRQKITGANHYDILQTFHGGSLSLRGEYKALSEWFDITLLTFHDDLDIYYDKVWMNEHYCVVPIAKPDALKEIENDFCHEAALDKINVYDSSIAVTRYYAGVTKFVSAVQNIAADSAVLIAEHPYTYRLLSHAMPDKSIWYRAHNVEYDFKSMVWQNCENHGILLDELYDLERECCDGCELVLTVTQADADRFHSLYNVPKSKLLNISVGMDISRFVLPSARESFSDNFEATALYLSSYSEGAVEAAKRVVDLARRTPMIMYYIVGDVCHSIKPENAPINLILAGKVSEEKKEEYLTCTDFALNLIEDGSGMNVKMLEYFAYGLPTITSQFGIRGISAVDKTHCIITSAESLMDDVLSFLHMSDAEHDAIAINALELVKKDHSWGSCINRLLDFLSTNNESLYDTLKTKCTSDTEQRISKDPEAINLDKTRRYFVYGAGKFGKKCIDMLDGIGIAPEGIIDNSSALWGQMINMIPVLSPQKFYKEDDADIIIAAGIRFAIEIIGQLRGNNIKLDNIYIAFDGVHLFSCGDRKGSNPYYYDFDKILTLANSVY